MDRLRPLTIGASARSTRVRDLGAVLGREGAAEGGLAGSRLVLRDGAAISASMRALLAACCTCLSAST
jgi:hypothetical protein